MLTRLCFREAIARGPNGRIVRNLLFNNAAGTSSMHGKFEVQPSVFDRAVSRHGSILLKDTHALAASATLIIEERQSAHRPAS